jgi:hypothetical protein
MKEYKLSMHREMWNIFNIVRLPLATPYLSSCFAFLSSPFSHLNIVGLTFA